MKDNTVKCPSCKEVFKVDDAVYNNIVNQVRDQQFKDELNTRIAAEKRDKEAALKTTELELNNKFQRELGNKQRELDVLRAKSKSDLIEEVSKKDARILTLESKINQGETDKKLALSDAIKTIEKERDQLLNNLRAKDTEMELKEKSLKEDLSFRGAFLEGAFTVPGDGCIDYKPLFDVLKEKNYSHCHRRQSRLNLCHVSCL